MGEALAQDRMRKAVTFSVLFRRTYLLRPDVILVSIPM